MSIFKEPTVYEQHNGVILSLFTGNGFLNINKHSTLSIITTASRYFVFPKISVVE